MQTTESALVDPNNWPHILLKPTNYIEQKIAELDEDAVAKVHEAQSKSGFCLVFEVMRYRLSRQEDTCHLLQLLESPKLNIYQIKSKHGIPLTYAFMHAFGSFVNIDHQSNRTLFFKLIEHADLNYCEFGSGYNLSHWIAKKGQSWMMQAIADRGVSLETASAHGLLPLNFIIERENAEPGPYNDFSFPLAEFIAILNAQKMTDIPTNKKIRVTL